MSLNNTPRVLLVDDDPLSLEVLASYLHGTGYEILKARDGEAAFKAARERSPDIVFLDIMMPGMDGKQVCQRLKGQEATRSIPVVMVTSLDTRVDKLDCINAGADDFLTKPVDKAELLARCSSLLKLKRFHDERDNAYSQITRLTSFCENIISGFAPAGFSLSEMYDMLMANMVKDARTADARPACAALLRTEGPTPVEGRLFSKPAGEHKWTAISPAGLTGLADATGIHSRSEGFANNIGAHFPDEVVSQAGEVVNHAFCRSGNTAIIFFNYGKTVIDYDLEVLRSLLSHSLFFQTIAGQARENEEAFVYTLNALARAAEANDEDTGNHILRVGEYSFEIAVNLGVPSHQAEEIKNASVTHDVGKIHVPPQILRKAGPLTGQEFEDIKMHTVYGVRILGTSPRLEVARQIAQSHHERWDGSGYPGGIKGEDIPLPGRIVAIADVYDALRNRRTYKPALGHGEALKIITQGDGRTLPSHFDPQVLGAFRDNSARMEEIFMKLSSQGELPPNG